MRLTALTIVTSMTFAACGGEGNDASRDGDDAAPTAETGGETDTETDTSGVVVLPAECVEAPFDIALSIDGFPEYSGTFTVTSAVGVATPIVPNGDGSLDDLDFQAMNDLGAATDLLLYTSWIGDHPFDHDDVSLFSGPEPPSGFVTLGLTVVPTSETALISGDVVSTDDEFAIDTITTFAPAGVYFQAAEGIETFFLVNNLDEAQGATVEVLHVDDDWFCSRWDAAGQTSSPDGVYSLSGVILVPLERGDTPFT